MSKAKDYFLLLPPSEPSFIVIQVANDHKTGLIYT